MSVSVRRLRFEDWALTRTLRLAALADAPDAFAATLADESAFPDARWQERARSNAEGVATAAFFALVDGVECGMAVGVWVAPGVELNALWVAPHARRKGAARALGAAVIAWAHERGATRVALDVAESNREAIALYRVLGFEPTTEAPRHARLPSLRMQYVLQGG